MGMKKRVQEKGEERKVTEDKKEGGGMTVKMKREKVRTMKEGR
jgi:hypothetical protein